MIKITDLVHKYTVWENETTKSKRTVLDGISLDIPSGCFMAILGTNGSGKSTLAKHLNVLLLPEEGTVWIDGKDTQNEDVLWEIRTKVGMVFQNPDNQIIGNSVEEDVAFGPENRNQQSPFIQHMVRYCLEQVGLSHKSKVSPMRLSGGEKQRVAIAGVLASSPDYIVLDEPTAMLDPNARKEVLNLIRTLNRDMGKTIILITHHTDEVLEADQIILMKDGHIMKKGTPKEIFAEPKLLQSVHMDVPQIVELGMHLKESGLDLETPILSDQQLIDELRRLKAKGGEVHA